MDTTSFHLNLNDYILLLSELLWPSYFIELFKKNGNGVVYEHILENLCKYFKLKNTEDIEKAIFSCDDTDKKIELYKRIDLNTLSKGERQIFILQFFV